jgi:hypothetical protein
VKVESLIALPLACVALVIERPFSYYYVAYKQKKKELERKARKGGPNESAAQQQHQQEHQLNLSNQAALHFLQVCCTHLLQ